MKNGVSAKVFREGCPFPRERKSFTKEIRGFMFDLKGLGDVSKIASQAKEMQRTQDKRHQEQMAVLVRISATLDEILASLKNKG